MVIDTIAEHSGKTFERYGTPGVCPSCQEPVTRRQRVITFERNLYGLGTVTFHLREKCRHAAFEYDREVHRDDGEFELTCPDLLAAVSMRTVCLSPIALSLIVAALTGSTTATGFGRRVSATP
ncbi:hypothetical protein [Gordonia westfalica]|uniref:hypothetical protein n=1 Tax=Gordonia westfalica TaxID=158898 RepID=UPI001113AF42|nr:hypothetical protein [Gordonia westfalica]